MTTLQQRKKDLATLTPEAKVGLMLDMVDALRTGFEDLRNESNIAKSLFTAFDAITDIVRRWTRGEAIEASTLIHPAYNAEGTDVVEIYADFVLSNPDQDIGVVADIIVRAALLAGFRQHARQGGQGTPIPYDSDLNDGDLAEILDENRNELSGDQQIVFDTLWEARFRQLGASF